MSPEPSPVLLSDLRDGVLELTLNRPERLNALNADLQRALAEHLGAAAANPAVRALILTGAGRAFSSGLDLRDFENSFNAVSKEKSRPDAFGALERVPQPIIAALHGYAVTGGFEIALGCDILIATPETRFADTHAQVGVMPGAGLSQKLSRIVGLPRAMALSLTGDFLTGEEAFRLGLVSHLVPREQLLPLARRLAQQIAKADPEIIRRLKRLIKDGGRLSLAGGLELEQIEMRRWKEEGRVSGIEERREAVMNRSREVAKPPGTSQDRPLK